MTEVLPSNVDDPRFAAAPVEPGWAERRLEPLNELDVPDAGLLLQAFVDAWLPVVRVR